MPLGGASVSASRILMLSRFAAFQFCSSRYSVAVRVFSALRYWYRLLTVCYFAIALTGAISAFARKASETGAIKVSQAGGFFEKPFGLALTAEPSFGLSFIHI